MSEPREPHFPVAPREHAFAAGKVGLLAVGTLDAEALKRVAAAADAGRGGVATGFVERLESSVLPAIGRLAAAVRAGGGPVLWARPTITTADARDWPAGLRTRVARWGLPFAAAAPGVPSEGAAPRPEDYVVPVGGISPFWAGNVGATLRHCGVEHVVVAGIETDNEVVIAAVDAANNDFQVTISSDACDALSTERHERALALHPFLYDVAATADLIPALAADAGVSSDRRVPSQAQRLPLDKS
jgi:nicotinamidase-related amidase